jgi:hypothetical protein
LIFRDHDGTWYYYAGLYERGYGIRVVAKFRIYRSVDQGLHWEDLGWGFEDGFCFDGETDPSDGCPDVVIVYDEKRKKYLLTYDTYTYDPRWLDTPDPISFSVTGAALAWADSPAGPFTRLPSRFVTNGPETACGKYNRCYASTVLPREKDYIAFILMDSGRYFAWGLAIATAPTAEGPWSKPSMVLSCDRAEYFPCPGEFYPTQFRDGKVYCPATSVAMNRNYQVVFEAPLEQAHDPKAWVLSAAGNLWHSANHPDEHHGIWGQTYHGFVEPDTGRYVVMFPSRDTNDFGTLSVAARPWDTPHSDGFTMTSHGGASISPLLAAYRDFTLDAAFTFEGTVEFAFAYRGILGPNDNISDAVPSQRCLSDYSAVRLEEDRCSILSVAADGTQRILGQERLPKKAESLQLIWHDGQLSVSCDGNMLFEKICVPAAAGITAPPALILPPFSRIECSKFQIQGETCDYQMAFHATDALLGAGQWQPDPTIVDPAGPLAADVWHRTGKGYVAEGAVCAKWNVIGSRFILPLERSPAYGTIGIWIDGHFQGSVDLHGQGETTFVTQTLPMGPHALKVAPLQGRIAIRTLLVQGKL